MTTDGVMQQRRPRRRPPTTSTLPLRPLACALALAGAAAAVWFVLAQLGKHRVTIVFDRDGTARAPIELTFFPDRLAFAAPSPPPPLATQQIDGDSVTVGRDVVPERAVVRYAAPGFGAGYTFVRLGEERPPVRLRPPSTLVGRVGEPISLWCFGWRCAGLRPVAGADVILMGGGEHGIEIVRTTSDADGRFELTGFDEALDGLGLRVQAAGFALAHASVARGDEAPVVALARAAPCRGRLVVPNNGDPTRLLVLARGLPGVQARPGADGTFALDHVPLGVSPRLLLVGLDALQTHAPARADARTAVRIEIVPAAIVRGRVVDAATKAPLAGALVWSGEQEATRCDDDGRYELQHQLPGDVELIAQWDQSDRRRRRTSFTGRTRVTLQPGSAHERIDIEVTTK